MYSNKAIQEYKRIENAKVKIREALLTKNILIPEGETLDNYYKYIDNIIIQEEPIYDLTNKDAKFHSFIYVTELPKINTTNRTDFYLLFSDCRKIRQHPSFDASKGVSFDSTFTNCHDLTSINIGSIPNATKLNNFANSCRNLSEVVISDYQNVVTTENAFYGANILEDITNLTNQQWDNLNHCGSMFRETNISTITQFEAPKVIHTSHMFRSCRNLQTVSGINTPNALHFYNNFSDCTSLTKIENCNFSSAQIFEDTFRECNNLISFNNVTIENNNVIRMNGAFYNCTSLTNLPFENFTFNNITEMGSTFENCNSLNIEEIILDAPLLVNMNNTFKSSGITKINLKNVDSLKYMRHTFFNSKLTDITIKNNTLEKVLDAQSCFEGTSYLRTMNTEELSLPNCLVASFMFKLSAIPGNLTLNLPKVNDLTQIFYQCPNIENITLKCDSLKNLYQAFQSSTSLVSVTLPDTSKVTNFSGFLSSCSSLQRVNEFDASSSTSQIDINFCPKLTELKIRNLNCDLNISHSNLITKESLLFIFNNAIARPSNSKKRIYISTPLFQTLEEHEKEIITNKNYDLYIYDRL